MVRTHTPKNLKNNNLQQQPLLLIRGSMLLLLHRRHEFLAAACLHNGCVFLICVSRATVLLRHTHHKSYSCNGAKHMSKTTSCTTTMTTIQICLLLPWLLRRHRCRHDADYADNDDAAMTPATLPTTTHFAAMTPTRDVFYIQSRPMDSLLDLSFMYMCGSA